MGLAPGTTVGPYRILECLGAGGMGEVYRARDGRLERDVALKILTPGKTADPDRKKRFIQEARAASALNHPGIVTIFDIGAAGEIDYIAMELIEGVTLDEEIPQKGLRLPLALRHAIAMADALAAAHAAGIVHRDLKPGNVMISRDGRIKLLDFGLAKLVTEGPLGDLHDAGTVSDSRPRTAEGAILGTVSYMAPEQAEGKSVDARSDIFSFGAILYEMLTGKRAFQSDTTLSTLSAILKEDPQRIGSLVEGVPPELERIIGRCLKKDPERRWQGMRDVKVALEELKEESDSGTLSLPVGVPPRAHPPRRGWVGGLAGGAAVLAALTLVIWWLRAPVVPVSVPKPADAAATTPRASSAGPTAPLIAAGAELDDGTPVPLILLEDLSLAAAKPGDRVALKVTRDIVAGGVVVIQRGAQASATVADADKKTVFRRSPKLTLRMGHVKAVDGESVRLRASAARPVRPADDVLDLRAMLSEPAAGARKNDRMVRSGTALVAYLDEVK